jgi:hypothetical protein
VVPAPDPADVKVREPALIHPFAGREEATDYRVCNNGLDDDCAGGDVACAALDADEDGVALRDDCDDGDPTIGAGLPEVPDDGIDQDCDGVVDEGTDRDGDGYVADAGPNGGDCDDSDPRVHPNRGEIPCNGIDDDCVGGDRCVMDDVDGDGVMPPDDCDDYDAGRAPGLTERCGDGIDQDCDGSDLPCPADDADMDGFGPDDDCNDDDPNISPNAPERCGDGVDQDCDGDDLPCPAPGQGDLDGDGFLPPADCNDDAAGINPTAIELCDRIDNDCDGRVDEGNPLQIPGAQPLAPTCGSNVGVCQAGPHVCSRTEGALGAEILCLATEGSDEVCDGFDNDCDGTADVPPPGQAQLDDEGLERCGPEAEVGNCRIGTLFCANGALSDCRGAVLGLPETCDGTDEDCDTRIDEGDVRAEPLTQDCFDGEAAQARQGICAAGTQTCTAGVFSACAGQQLPGEEICDDIDNDCDGRTDEGVGEVCYTFDPETQGAGQCRPGNRTCQPDGSLGDCENQVGPRPELCNALDDDCDGLIDQYAEPCLGEPGQGFDLRLDGTGICLAGTRTCVNGAFGECAGDVPPRGEICNRNIDDDCDGQVDEGFDLINDRNNCGGCGVVCSAGQACCNGGCRALDTVQDCGACDAGCGRVGDGCGQGAGGLQCECGGGAACEDGLQCVDGQCQCLANEDCGDDRLCCDGQCEASDFETQCETCGAACEGGLATACENRRCVCGNGQACEPGGQSVCAQADGQGDFRCRGCREDRGNADCAAGSICCGGICRDVSAARECEDCNRACDLNSADVCASDGDARDCRCGDGAGAAECANQEPFCLFGAALGDGRCVDCRADNDCARPQRPGLFECVDTVCRACDPSDHASCGADQLCCNFRCIDTSEAVNGNCEACGDSCDVEQTNQCDSRSCGCGDNAPCDLNSATPLCDDPRGQCVQCRADVDCAGHPGGAQCVDNVCSACDPNGHDGCGANELCCVANGSPVCQSTSDAAGQCESCNGACDGLSTNRCTARSCGCGNGEPCGGAFPVCDDGANECVECTADVHCNNSPNGSQCVNRECRRCDPSDQAGCGGDQLCCGADASLRCEGTQGGVAGQCESCGAACGLIADTCSGRDCQCGADAECSGATPFCDTGACVQCLGKADCGLGELCCDGECQPTGGGVGEQCEQCGVACDQDASNRCSTQQTCVCGGGDRCGEPSPICRDNVGVCADCSSDGDCDAGESQCVNFSCLECDAGDAGAGYVCNEAGAEPICANGGCRQCNSNAECASRPGARDQCVGDACEVCNPQGNTGCPADAPICDREQITCRQCDNDNECGNGLECVQGQCQGCDPGDDSPCGGATPICDPGSFQCAPCANDAECLARPGNDDQCVAGECRSCDTGDSAGCGADELCCNFQCQAVDFDACTACNNGACSAQTADTCDGRVCECGNAVCAGETPFCEGADCVECLNDGDCGGATPECVANTCVACDPATQDGCDTNSDRPFCALNAACVGCGGDDARCAGNFNGEECLAGGSCGICDPANNDGCVDSKPICNGGNECEPCQTDEQCGAEQFCITAGALTGECGDCDPADDDGCSGNTPVCNGAATCEACDANGDCGGATPICTGNGSCGVCDTVDSEGCNAGSRNPVCRGGNGGIDCQRCQNDGQCDAVDGAPGGQCITGGGNRGACEACDTADNAGCDGDTPICGNNFTCRGCARDGECAGGFCDDASGRCIECRNSGDCGDEVCTDGACRDCVFDVQCLGHPYGFQCRGPAGSRGCGCSDAGIHCFATACGVDNVCEQCGNDGDCAGNPNGEVCGAGLAGVCGCDADIDCGTNVCVDNQCMPCDGINDCGQNPNGPVCAMGECGCGQTADCGGRVCDSALCVDCGNDADCAGHPRGAQCGAVDAGQCGCDGVEDCGGGLCDGGTCRPCAGNNDCVGHPSGEACVNGACQGG